MVGGHVVERDDGQDDSTIPNQIGHEHKDVLSRLGHLQNPAVMDSWHQALLKRSPPQEKLRFE